MGNLTQDERSQQQIVTCFGSIFTSNAQILASYWKRKHLDQCIPTWNQSVFNSFYRAPFQNLLLKVTFVLMEALFFCCLILCCCKGRGLEPWASEELGETCWPREGTPAILGREEAGGGTTWGEDVVCCGKEDDEETEEEGGRPLSCRKTSNMDEVEVVAW